MGVFLTKPLDTLKMMIQLFPFPHEMDPFITHHIGFLIHIPFLTDSFITYSPQGSELKTLEWDILNPDWIINLEIKNEWRTSNI